jgi:hypothetical protein
MTTAFWTAVTGEKQDLHYPAARFNERGSFLLHIGDALRNSETLPSPPPSPGQSRDCRGNLCTISIPELTNYPPNLLRFFHSQSAWSSLAAIGGLKAIRTLPRDFT